MKLLSKEVFIPHREGKGVFPGFIKYISNDKPILMHRHGWIEASDTYDNYGDSISTDNGKTWSEPVMALQSTPDETGVHRYAENAAFFDPQTQLLHTITSHSHYGKDQHISHNRWTLHFNIYNPATDTWRTPWRSNMGFESGLMLSFSVPIETTQGKILLPAQTKVTDDQGNYVFKPGYWTPLLQALVLIGQRKDDGVITWTPGKTITADPDKSSRGMCEPAIAQLKDGRIAMVARGDNGFFPEKPGYKWLSFSNDGGQSWCEPSALTLADGSPIESGATGSALFRSRKNGKLYWIGNPAMDGQRAKGNWPRHPLVVAQVQEEPFGLMRETFTTIDTRQPGESEQVQMSNFRFYEDRVTGELVVFLCRYGENHPQAFKVANYYRYRVQLDD